MKKLYDLMYKIQIGDRPPGTWSSENRIQELEPIFQQFETARWTTESTLVYNDINVEKTALHLNLDAKTVKEWMFDPKYKRFQETTITYSVLDRSETDLIDNLCKLLNLSTLNVDIRMQNQKPGEMVGLHLDGYKHHVFNLPVEKEYLVVRYAIFLEDQQLGQTWFINKDFLHWRKGDVFTWDQSTVPHGTANIGFHDRPVLVVTGMALE
jgi:hypothetical protein